MNDILSIMSIGERGLSFTEVTNMSIRDLLMLRDIWNEYQIMKDRYQNELNGGDQPDGQENYPVR